MNNQTFMFCGDLSLDAALTAINHTKVINIRKREKCSSADERKILNEEFEMYCLEERIVHNQSKDLAL